MSFIRSAFANAPMFTREQYARWTIDEAKAAGFPDWRGAAVCTVMGMFQEAGNDPHKTGKQQIWNPGNHADPCYHQNPGAYPHDSEGDDGRSTGCLQQQMNAPGTTPWGWGGNYGDCNGTRRRMTPVEAIRMFYTWPGSGLKFKNMNASSAAAAGASVQRVQGSSFPDAYTKWWNEANKLVDQVINNTGEPQVPSNRPDFNEFPFYLSGNSSDRNVANIDLWLLHTQEPPRGSDNRNDAALELRNFLESTKGSDNPVSYHYTGSMANDGGTTIIDCVDTDEACWAVGNSNDRSINFCFAGSRSDWTRQEWLDNERGTIEAAAYLFVQDCAKYPKLKARVIAPNYSAPPGAADHNYCTKFLKDGNNHTDVGPNFPWDTFAAAVTKYASGAPSAPQPGPILPLDYSKETWDQVRIEWKQLGDRTLVNAIGAIGEKLGVEGMFDIRQQH